MGFLCLPNLCFSLFRSFSPHSVVSCYWILIIFYEILSTFYFMAVLEAFVCVFRSLCRANIILQRQRNKLIWMIISDKYIKGDYHRMKACMEWEVMNITIMRCFSLVYVYNHPRIIFIILIPSRIHSRKKQIKSNFDSEWMNECL